MDLTDPALLVALLLGVLAVFIVVRLQPKPLPVPHCRACEEPMERDEIIVDPEHPEHRYVPGEREAWFVCRECGERRRARF